MPNNCLKKPFFFAAVESSTALQLMASERCPSVLRRIVRGSSDGDAEESADIVIEGGGAGDAGDVYQRYRHCVVCPRVCTWRIWLVVKMDVEDRAC